MNTSQKHFKTRFGVLKVPETIGLNIQDAKTSLVSFLETQAFGAILAISTKEKEESPKKEYISVLVDLPNNKVLKKFPRTWEGFDVVVRNMRTWRKK